MEIDDMSTEKIKKYLEGRKKKEPKVISNKKGCLKAADLIMNSIYWNKTVEGDDYWAEVYTKLNDYSR